MKQILNSGPVFHLGWVVALSVLIPLGLGVLLDRRFHTAPLFILIGAGAGIIVGTIGAVRITSRVIEGLAPSDVDARAKSLTHDKEDDA